MFPDEALQLRNKLGMVSQREVRLDPLLECAESLLLQACALPPGKADRVELGQRSAAPEGERLSQLLRGPGRLLHPRLRDQPLEALQVELAFLHPNQVAGRLGHDHVAAEGLAQLRDMNLNGCRGGLWRLVAPKLVDQAVTGDDLVRVQEQERQDRALFCAAEIQATAVAAVVTGSALAVDRPAASFLTKKQIEAISQSWAARGGVFYNRPAASFLSSAQIEAISQSWAPRGGVFTPPASPPLTPVVGSGFDWGDFDKGAAAM